jgi:hypothetical protein
MGLAKPLRRCCLMLPQRGKGGWRKVQSHQQNPSPVGAGATEDRERGFLYQQWYPGVGVG